MRINSSNASVSDRSLSFNICVLNVLNWCTVLCVNSFLQYHLAVVNNAVLASISFECSVITLLICSVYLNSFIITSSYTCIIVVISTYICVSTMIHTYNTCVLYIVLYYYIIVLYHCVISLCCVVLCCVIVLLLCCVVLCRLGWTWLKQHEGVHMRGRFWGVLWSLIFCL